MRNLKGSTLVIPRLSLMMFFQYFVLGSWFSTLGLILTNHGLSSSIGIAYSIGGIAAIISPLFLGMITDRFFPSEKVLGAVNLLGGILLWFMPKQVYLQNSMAFLCLMFLYMLCFNPTYSLTNNISFSNVRDSNKWFPIIRVCGTVGFIIAGFFIGGLGFSGSPVAFYIGAIASILHGLYCFTLPNTPAQAKGKPFSFRDILCLDALTLLKNRNFLVFIICTVLLFTAHAAYMSFSSVYLSDMGVSNVASVLTIGQMSEIVAMLLIPLFLLRLGYKYMFLIGMFAWILRLSLLAISAINSNVTLAIIAVALHGFCWDFFFIAGYMYTDQIAHEKIKSQAQGLIIMFTQGIGMFVGSFVMGNIYNQVVTEQGINALNQWKVFWSYPTIFAIIITIVFTLMFKEKINRKKCSVKNQSPHTA